MGMIGCYVRTDDIMTRQIQNGAEIDISSGKENVLDIDKSWHAIHFTLTGEVWGADEKNILSQIVFGGEPVNDEDMGYGPARLLKKALVYQLSNALEKIDESSFRQCFDIDGMIENHVYPIMDDENVDEFFEYVWSNFKELKEFFRQAADQGQNIISFIY